MGVKKSAGGSMRGRRLGRLGGVGEKTPALWVGDRRWTSTLEDKIERNPGEQPMCGQANTMLPLQISRRPLWPEECHTH